MSIASELLAGVIGASIGWFARMGRRGRTYYLHVMDDDADEPPPAPDPPDNAS